ncbi:MAG: hypothetical protein R3F60_24215 [bacterium]
MRASTGRALVVAACALWVVAMGGRHLVDALGLRPENFSDTEALDRWRWWIELFGYGSLAGTVAAAIGLVALIRGGGAGGVVAAIGGVAMALVAGGYRVTALLQLDVAELETWYDVLGKLQFAGWAVCGLGMIATLRHRGSRGPIWVVTAAALGLSLGLWLVGVLKLLEPGRLASLGPWHTAVVLVQNIGFGLLYLRAPIVDPVATAADAHGLGSPAAAAGLRGFTDLLVARLVILVISIGLTFVVRDSVAGVKLFLTGGTLLGMALGLAMVTSLLRFAGASPAGGGPARVAAAMLGVGLLLDAWTLKLVSDLFGTRLGAAFWAADALPWAQGIGQVIGLIALLGVIAAGRDVALLAGDAALASRAGGLRVGVLAVAALAFGLRLVASGRRPNVALLLPLAVAVLVGALVMIVGVIRLTRAAADHLDRPAAP